MGWGVITELLLTLVWSVSYTMSAPDEGTRLVVIGLYWFAIWLGSTLVNGDVT